MGPGTCVKCGVQRRAIHHDHIVPLWAGGSDDASNIQTLCANCHEDKTIDEKRTPAYALALGPRSTAVQLRRWAEKTDEERIAHGFKMRAGRSSEADQKNSEAVRAKWADPEWRQRMLAAQAAGRASKGVQ